MEKLLKDSHCTNKIESRQNNISQDHFQEVNNPFSKLKTYRCLLCSGLFTKSKQQHDRECQYTMAKCEQCFKRFPKLLIAQHNQICAQIKAQREQERKNEQRIRRQRRRQRNRNYQRIVNQLRSRNNFYPQRQQIYGNLMREASDYHMRHHITQNQIIQYSRYGHRVILRNEDQREYNDIIRIYENSTQNIIHTQKNEILEKILKISERIIDKQGQLQEDICVICQYQFRNQQHILKLPCKHIYHQLCIQKWLYQKAVCPMCKQKIPI